MPSPSKTEGLATTILPPSVNARRHAMSVCIVDGCPVIAAGCGSDVIFLTNEMQVDPYRLPQGRFSRMVLGNDKAWDSVIDHSTSFKSNNEKIKIETEKINNNDTVCSSQPSVNAVAWCDDNAMLAVAVGEDVFIYSPFDTTRNPSSSSFQSMKYGPIQSPYIWHEVAILTHDSVVLDVAWRPGANHLLTVGEVISVWSVDGIQDKVAIAVSQAVDDVAKEHQYGSKAVKENQLNAISSGWDICRLWSCRVSVPDVRCGYSGDGELFATCAKFSRTIRIWFNRYDEEEEGIHHTDLSIDSLTSTSSTVEFSYIYLSHPRSVIDFEWNPNPVMEGCRSNSLLSLCIDGLVRLWVETGREEDAYFFTAAVIDCSSVQLRGLSSNESSQKLNGENVIPRGSVQWLHTSTYQRSPLTKKLNRALPLRHARRRLDGGSSSLSRNTLVGPTVINSMDWIIGVSAQGTVLVWCVCGLADHPRHSVSVSLVASLPMLFPGIENCHVLHLCAFAFTHPEESGVDKQRIPAGIRLFTHLVDGSIHSCQLNLGLRNIGNKAPSDTQSFTLSMVEEGASSYYGLGGQVVAMTAHISLPIIATLTRFEKSFKHSQASNTTYCGVIHIWNTVHCSPIQQISISLESMFPLDDVGDLPILSFAPIGRVLFLVNGVSASSVIILYCDSHRRSIDDRLSWYYIGSLMESRDFSNASAALSFPLHLDESSDYNGFSVKDLTCRGDREMVSTSDANSDSSNRQVPISHLNRAGSYNKLIHSQDYGDSKDDDSNDEANDANVVLYVACSSNGLTIRLWRSLIYNNENNIRKLSSSVLSTFDINIRNVTIVALDVFGTHSLSAGDRTSAELSNWSAEWTSSGVPSVAIVLGCSDGYIRLTKLEFTNPDSCDNQSNDSLTNDNNSNVFNFIIWGEFRTHLDTILLLATSTADKGGGSSAGSAHLVAVVYKSSASIIHVYDVEDSSSGARGKEGSIDLGNNCNIQSLAWLDCGIGNHALAVCTNKCVQVWSRCRSPSIDDTSSGGIEVIWKPINGYSLPLCSVSSSRVFLAWVGVGSALAFTTDSPSTLSLKVTDAISHQPSLYSSVTEAQGSLPLYHPRVLTDMIISGNKQWVSKILSYLYTTLHDAAQCDNAASSMTSLSNLSLQISLNDLLTENAGTTTTQSSSLLSSSSPFGLQSSSSSLSSSWCAELSQLLVSSVMLPGLSSTEQLSLLTVIEIYSEIQSQSDFDDCALRFLVEYKLFCFNKHNNKNKIKNSNEKETEMVLASSAVTWAQLSESQSWISATCLGTKKDYEWKDLKMYGVPLWLNSETELKSMAETMAKNRFMQSRDGCDSALFYVAVKKISVLVALFRSVQNVAMTKFFGNDYTVDSNRTIALKNAFVLLSKHRYEMGAAVYLLAGRPNDACDICAVNMNDISLSLMIARLVDASWPEFNKQTVPYVIERYLLPKAAELRDEWLTVSIYFFKKHYVQAISSISYYKFESDTTPSMVAPITMFSNIDPSLAILYQHLKSLSYISIPSSMLISEFHLRRSCIVSLLCLGCNIVALDRCHVLQQTFLDSSPVLASIKNRLASTLLAASLQQCDSMTSASRLVTDMIVLCNRYHIELDDIVVSLLRYCYLCGLYIPFCYICRVIQINKVDADLAKHLLLSSILSLCRVPKTCGVRSMTYQESHSLVSFISTMTQALHVCVVTIPSSSNILKNDSTNLFNFNEDEYRLCTMLLCRGAFIVAWMTRNVSWMHQTLKSLAPLSLMAKMALPPPTLAGKTNGASFSERMLLHLEGLLNVINSLLEHTQRLVTSGNDVSLEFYQSSVIIDALLCDSAAGRLLDRMSLSLVFRHFALRSQIYSNKLIKFMICGWERYLQDYGRWDSYCGRLDGMETGGAPRPPTLAPRSLTLSQVIATSYIMKIPILKDYWTYLSSAPQSDALINDLWETALFCSPSQLYTLRYNLKGPLELFKRKGVNILSVCVSPVSVGHYAAVATSEGIREFNYHHSCRFRRRSDNGLFLLDMDLGSYRECLHRFDEYESHSVGSCTDERRPPLVPAFVNGPSRSSSTLGFTGSTSNIIVDRTTAVTCLASHPSLPIYLSGGYDGSVLLWQFANSQPAHYFGMTSLKKKVQRVRFNAVGNRFGTCDDGGVVSFWHMDAGSGLSTLCDEVRCHGKRTLDMTYMNAGTLFVTAGEPSSGGSSVAAYDLLSPTAQQCVFESDDHGSGGAHSIIFSPRYQLVLSGGSRNGDIIVLDIRQRRVLRRITAAHTMQVRALALDPLEHFFVSGSTDGDVIVWDLATLEQFASYGSTHDKKTFMGGKAGGSGVATYGVTDIATTTDVVMTCGADGCARMLWH